LTDIYWGFGIWEKSCGRYPESRDESANSTPLPIRNHERSLAAMGMMVDADAVLFGGNVITVNDQQPRAQGVAIKDGRFLGVGTNEEIKPAIGRGTRVRDLKGMTVVPGFIESHNHTMMFGLGLNAIDLTQVHSVEVGKLANLVVLTEDLTKVDPNRIKDIPIMATMVGGEFCYERT
jgi:predicted amidohydrolase YtcJ